MVKPVLINLVALWVAFRPWQWVDWRAVPEPIAPLLGLALCAWLFVVMYQVNTRI